MVGWNIKNLIFILFNSLYRALNVVLYGEFYFMMNWGYRTKSVAVNADGTS